MLNDNINNRIVFQKKGENGLKNHTFNKSSVVHILQSRILNNQFSTDLLTNTDDPTHIQ